MMLIFKKEVLENLGTYRFAILTGVLCVLVALSLLVSYGDYRLRKENYDLLRPKEPNSAKIIISPTPLSIFAKGLDANLARLYEESGLGIEVHENQQSANRLFSLFAVPDMLFIIKVVLSLIALLMSFDAVSAEKERGTLKLMLATGAQKTTLLLGKLLGRCSLVYVPFLIFCLAGIIVLSLLPAVQIDTHVLDALFVIMIVSALYVVMFSALGIFSSTLMHRSSSALMLSMAIWVLLVFVIPQMGTTAAVWMADVPTGDRVEMESRLAAIQAIYERIQSEKSGREGNAGIRMIERVHAANKQLSESYRPKLNRLVAVTKDAVRCSPAGVLTFLVTDAANTGIFEELRFKDAIVLYIERNFNRIVQLERGPVEDFQYRRAALGEVFSRSAFTDAIILVLFTLAGIGLSFAGFFKYDAR